MSQQSQASPQGQMLRAQNHQCLEILIIHPPRKADDCTSFRQSCILRASSADSPSTEDESTLMRQLGWGATCVRFDLNYSKILTFPELTIQYL